MIKINVAWCLLLVNFVHADYSPPKAKVEPLSPRGLRISIPNDPGMTLVAFHAKFNEDFQGLEAGTIARDIVRNRNGRWTYEDRTTKLRQGDVIYYWIHVIWEGLGYNLLDQQHRVTEFFSAETGARVNEDSKDGGSENRACRPSISAVVDPQTGARRNDVCSGELLLDERFDNLNRSIWRIVEKFAGSPDYAFVIYRNDERNVKCVQGNLQVTPTLVESELGKDFVRRGNFSLERCTEESETLDCQRSAVGAYILPPIFSGLIDTKNSLAFTYGRIEIRAKLPRGDWIYPVLSLEQRDKSLALRNSLQAEMRIASSNGNSQLRDSSGNDCGGRVLRSGPVDRNSQRHIFSSLSKKCSDKLWSNDYHVYELEWTRNKILSRVDGLEYGSTEITAPFDKLFYLKLGLAVGGHDEFPDEAVSDTYGKPWRNVGSKAVFEFFNATDLWSGSWNDDSKSLKIDYVKLWAV